MEINPETDKPDKDGFSQKGCIRKMYANRWKRYWKKKRKKKKKGERERRNFAQKRRIKFVISTQRVKFMNSLYQGNISS